MHLMAPIINKPLIKIKEFDCVLNKIMQNIALILALQFKEINDDTT